MQFHERDSGHPLRLFQHTGVCHLHKYFIGSYFSSRDSFYDGSPFRILEYRERNHVGYALGLDWGICNLNS